MNTTAAGFSLRESGSDDAIPLKDVEAAIEIAGFLAHTTITQRYRNDSASVIEAVYAFPLPSEAILLGLDIEIGENTLSGIVQARESAEESYEDAIAEGDGAFLLRELDEALFEMRLGNLKAGEAVSIRLRYAEVLHWSGGVLRYRMPTVIAPHYGDAGRAGIAENEAPRIDVFAEHAFILTATVNGALASGNIFSPTHAVVVHAEDDLQTIALKSNAQLDRDFILLIENHHPAPWEVWYAPDGDGYAAIGCLIAPSFDQTVTRQTRDLIIILDCSGSMSGDSIAQTRLAMLSVIDDLNDGDRLVVTRFGSSVDNWYDGPVVMSPGTRTQLKARVLTLEADLGGTEIVQGIEAALERSPAGADVLLITDGEAWEEEATLLRLAHRGYRFFTVGVGASVSEKILRVLADASNGATEYVTPNEQMGARIVAHSRRMLAPRATLEIEWGAAVLTEPKKRGVVFAGDTFPVMARLGAAPVNPKATIVTEAGAVTLAVTPVGVSGELAAALPRIVAEASLTGLDETSATAVAVEYQLLTAHTGMVAVLERAEDEKAEGLPTLNVVPQMLSAGWGGTGSVLSISRMPSGGHISACMPSRDYDVEIPLRTTIRDEIDPILFVSIEDFELSDQTMSALRRKGVEYIGELIQLTEAELLRSPDFGKKHLAEIKDALAVLDLCLDMRLENWSRPGSNDARKGTAAAGPHFGSGLSDFVKRRSVNNPVSLLDLLQCAIEQSNVTDWAALCEQEHWLKLWNDDVPEKVAAWITRTVRENAIQHNSGIDFAAVMQALVEFLLHKLALPYEKKRRLRNLRQIVRRADEQTRAFEELVRRVERDFAGTRNNAWVVHGETLAVEAQESVMP